MPKSVKEATLDDVHVLGEWNFTLQSDTPLYWIKSGNLDRYLLRFRAHSPGCPSTFGIVFHAEADGPGTDGCSFWIERSAGFKNQGEPTKRYLLAGDALESQSVITRPFPDSRSEEVEDVQMLVQGYTGVIFLQDRKVQIKFRLKHLKGSVAFYNTTQANDAFRDDVTFSGVAITALRRGPMEIAGKLGQREQAMLGRDSRPQAGGASDGLVGEAAAADLAVGNQASLVAAGPSTRGGGGCGGRSSMSASDPSAAFRATAPERQSGSRTGPVGTRSVSAVAGRGSGRNMASASQTWGKGRGAAKGVRLRQSASDGVLRKSGGSLFAATTGSNHNGGGWIPVATNAHMGEQELLKDVNRRELETGACKDFIAM